MVLENKKLSGREAATAVSLNHNLEQFTKEAWQVALLFGAAGTLPWLMERTCLEKVEVGK